MILPVQLKVLLDAVVVINTQYYIIRLQSVQILEDITKVVFIDVNQSCWMDA